MIKHPQLIIKSSISDVAEIQYVVIARMPKSVQETILIYSVYW